MFIDVHGVQRQIIVVQSKRLAPVAQSVKCVNGGSDRMMPECTVH